MNTRDALTKILAIMGAVLVWLTLLSPLVLWVAFGLGRGAFRLDRIDYLAPGELFPLALVGGGLLVWAALRRRQYRTLIIGSLSLATLALVGVQLLAVVTGLASGESEPVGWKWTLVLGVYGIFLLGLLGLGVGGILCARRPTSARLKA